MRRVDDLIGVDLETSLVLAAAEQQRTVGLTAALAALRASHMVDPSLERAVSELVQFCFDDATREVVIAIERRLR